MLTRTGAPIEKVYSKHSRIAARFTEDGEPILVEVKRTGRMRDLPLATAAFQEDPEEVRKIYVRQGVAWSNRTQLAA